MKQKIEVTEKDYIQLGNIEFCTSIYPDITEQDFEIIFDILNAAGFRYSYFKESEFKDWTFIHLYYKIPHIFIDDNGTKYCIGEYTKNMTKEALSDEIGVIHIAKNYQRPANTELPWKVNYEFEFDLKGSCWLNNRKHAIGKIFPKGVYNIKKESENMESFKQDFENCIKTLKRYIDSGTPVK